MANTQHIASSPYADPSLLAWSLALPHSTLWVENVPTNAQADRWGQKWNAAQFLERPIQNRVRVVGGRYKTPEVFWEYRRFYRGLCPAIICHEYQGITGNFTASQSLGRDLSIRECGYYQGLDIPDAWFQVPEGVTPLNWRKNVYEGLGNGVPTYMSFAFGKCYKT